MPFLLLAPLWPAIGSNMAPRRSPGGPKTLKSPDFDAQILQTGIHLASKMSKNDVPMARKRDLTDAPLLHSRFRCGRTLQGQVNTDPRVYALTPHSKLLHTCAALVIFSAHTDLSQLTLSSYYGEWSACHMAFAVQSWHMYSAFDVLFFLLFSVALDIRFRQCLHVTSWHVSHK